jgi:hypothetical protein
MVTSLTHLERGEMTIKPTVPDVRQPIGVRTYQAAQEGRTAAASAAMCLFRGAWTQTLEAGTSPNDAQCPPPWPGLPVWLAKFFPVERVSALDVLALGDRTEHRGEAAEHREVQHLHQPRSMLPLRRQDGCRS